MNQNIIEVRNLKKIYNPRKNPIEALKGISFDVRKGEIFGLLGVNGAGKSTTLNILIGVLTASGGSVKIFGMDFFKNEEEIKQRMNIATAYADLAGSLTVQKNLQIYAIMYHVPNYPKKIIGLAQRFEISHLLKKKFVELSAGQKTRVNLCKSLINDPEILLLDEPTASLDPSIAAHTRDLLLSLQKQQKLTIVVTSHNMDEVEQVCDQVALLDKGHIYMIDTPANLMKHHDAPSLEELFIRLARGELDD